MNTRTTVAPVRRSITVERPVQEAFRLFTEEIATWWPLQAYSVAAPRADDGVEPQTVVLEPREGGRIYERMSNGEIVYWGEVLAWEPPRRLVIAWQPNPDAPAPTEIEIAFTPQGAETLVELEHRGWDRLGDRAELARTEYDLGWDGVLGRYAAAGRDNGLAIASFVVGLASLVIPFVAVLGGPIAAVFGVIGRRRARRGARHGGLATAGLTLGTVAFVVWVGLGLFVMLGFSVSGSSKPVRGPVRAPVRTVPAQPPTQP